MAENNCVVCFKNVRIYSVGECDHPVCYECSTRMRVLCRQNECPMCRHEMEIVVFTERIRPFRRLKRNYNLYDKEHHIAFENDYIQGIYNNLLHFVCKKCQREPVFNTFESLNEHMKKEHDLYCCDLCADTLKIFPAERRYYTKSELNRHKRIGDIDDRSHRGHPLCEFCNVRYVDRDELYKHLRKEHLFCHICDSEGVQQFYGKYVMLREHYRTDHFLCEEGDCIKEQLTSVFPSKIDLKAHKALVHCRNLRNRQAVKQARTLDLEFTLAPRITNDRRGRVFAQESSQEIIANNSLSNQIQENAENIMKSWEQAFPSLSNSVIYSTPRPKFIREINNKLAFNEQNFPALGSETNVKISSSTNTDSRPSTSGTVVSSTSNFMQLNQDRHNHANKNSNQINNTPSSSLLSLTWVGKAKEKKLPVQKNDLPSSSADLVLKPPSLSRKNFPNLQNNSTNNSNKSNKKNKNISGAIPINENNNSLKMNYSDVAINKNDDKKDIPNNGKSKEEVDVNKDNKNHCFLLNANRKKVKMKPETFTNLNEQANNINSVLPSASGRSVHSDFKTSKKGKVDITTSKTKNCDNFAVVELTDINCDNNNKKINTNKKSKTKEKIHNFITQKDKENEKKSSSGKENSNQNIKNKNEEKNLQLSNNLSARENNKENDKEIINDIKNENKSKSIKIKLESNVDFPNEFDQNKVKNNDIAAIFQTNDNCNLINSRKPPPGFDKSMTLSPPPPPGFVSLHENNFQNSGNDDQFSISNLAPNSLFIYQEPDEFVSRNSQLIENISHSLIENGKDALDDFKNTSLLFREGYISASIFYVYCRKKIKKNYFEEVFIDLVTLLPNIFKQQELWIIHQSVMSENLETTSIENCKICFQILKLNDVSSHYIKHGITAKKIPQNADNIN